MLDVPVGNPALLAVFSSKEDRTILRAILDRSGWDLRFTPSFEEARNALHAFHFKAVLSDGFLPDGHCWQDLLREIAALTHQPPLIVADRQADERLWVEVLNLGGWNLISKPLKAKEVLHVLSVACGLRENKEPLARPERRSPATTARAARVGT